MKAFSFSLEAVLTLRGREEQIAAGNWAKAVQAQARAEEAHVIAKAELERCHRQIEESRRELFRPGDLHIQFETLSNQKALCDQLAGFVAKAVEFTRQQHAALLQARMKYEVLKRLKQKRMKEHECAIVAKEEAVIDDLVIARYGARKSQA